MGERGPARDDDQRRGVERAALGLPEPGGRLPVDADFGGERKMNERDDSQARCFVLDHRGHRAERETVDEHERAATHLGEHPRGMLQRRRCGVRKALVELADPD